MTSNDTRLERQSTRLSRKPLPSASPGGRAPIEASGQPGSAFRTSGSGGWHSNWRMTGEWGSWLARLRPWTHFFTGTFALERKTPEAVIRSYRLYLQSLSREGVEGQSFAVVEGDERTRLHVHCLSVLSWSSSVVCPPSELSYRGGALREARSLVAWRAWYETRGRARCEPIRGSATGAAFYIAKYLCKETEPRFFFLPDDAWTGTLRR